MSRKQKRIVWPELMVLLVMLGALAFGASGRPPRLAEPAEEKPNISDSRFALASKGRFALLEPQGNGYAYQRTITINHTKVPNTDQANFPVLVNGTYPYLATVANGGNVQNAYGYDVIFTSDSGCATKLNHEVETYYSATGTVNYWVKVPTVSHTSDSVFYLCYGNASISTDQSNKTAVWDGNYKGVWHLPNGTGLTTTDSTANANHSSSSSALATAGRIDGAASYNGAGQSTVISNPANFDFEHNQAFSVEFWLKKPLDTVTNQILISKKNTYWTGAGFDVWTWAGSNNAIFDLMDSAGTWYEIGSNVNVQDNVWHHIVCTYDGSSNRSGMKMYVDGTLTSAGSPAAIPNTVRNPYNLTFGANSVSQYDYLNGSLDEVRFSSTSRSADWIKTEYNNQSSPETFYTVSATSGGESPPTVYRASTDFSAVQGHRNWYYLDSTGAQMVFVNQWGGVWQTPNTSVILGSSWGHPGEPGDAVRQWRAPASGSVRITGTAFDSDPGGADGVIVSIRKGTQVLWERTIENGDANGFSYDVTTNVATGDQINFVINRRSNTYWDSTIFDPTITFTGGGAAIVNLALNKPATQSSDPGWGGPPSKAVDGNTSGSWYDGSVTHTNYDAQAWWQVDLGALQSIQGVELWNRMDCCSERLTNFNVILLDTNQTVVASLNVPGQAASPTTVPISGTARYVKVQLVGTNYLSLAEVRVWGGGSANNGADTVWVEDAVPAGAVVGGDSEGWNWIGSSPGPVSGSLSHQSNVVSGLHQHYFYSATSTLTVNAGDKLFSYVYVDPANIPSEVMLQWNDGSWDHRAYWGANNLGWGTDGTSSRRYMGALPTAGGWVRLEVAASAVGLEGRTLNGMAFSLWGGRATWDRAGKLAASSSNQSPVANTGGPYNGTAATAVQFNGSGSDPDGQIVSYAWNFGDGGTASGNAPSHTYTAAGTYSVTLTVTDNGNLTASASTTATIQPAAPPYAAAFVSQTVPGSMVAGQSYNVSVTMQNTGSNTWTSANSYRLGSQNPQDNMIWRNGRVELPASVAPGTQAVFNFTVTAPSTAGTYNFQWRMLQELVTWFGDFTPNVVVNVANAGPPATNVIWTNVSSTIQVNGNSLAKVAGTNQWDAGAVSTQTISGNGYVQFTTGNATTWRMCGLGSGDSSTSYDDIEFAFYLEGNGNLYVFESGQNRGYFGAYTGTDSLKVATEGGVVKYYRNGTLLYTSALTPQFPLLVDTSLNTQNSSLYQLTNVVIYGSSGSNPPGGGANARLDPANRTGGEDEDPLSRNFNWSVPLIELPGRSGLDLGLSLSYNSLVWTKGVSTISFDDDRGFPSPGFRLGFPVIQASYFNSEVGKNAFLLITTNGERVELRQLGSSSLYEAADSSHLLLDSSTMILRTTDGTQLSYELKGADFQCTKIKDRNGNIITINYTSSGRIDTVIDTLSRTIRFNYDAGNYLLSITQLWNGQSHLWAGFTYNPNLVIKTNFTGVTNVGPQNDSTIKVLDSIQLNNSSSSFYFDYTSWGQVWKIRNYASDGQTLLNYRSYNLPINSSAPEADCPRFTQRHDWAKDWNRSGPDGLSRLPAGAEQEVTTTYEAPVSTSWTPPGGTQQTGKMAWVTSPDGTSNKIYFAGAAGTPTGWQRGLPSMVETYSGSTLQRQSVTTWTQDNTAASYILNPRVSETNVYDPSGNRRRVTISYTSFTLSSGISCSLATDTFEYAADPNAVLRHTQTDYRMDVSTDYEYLNRHIIGLVKEQRLYENGGTGTPKSRVAFAYDQGTIQGNDTPVQHDNTYNSSFMTGRANLTSLTRYDVLNPGQSVTSSMQYNTAGSKVVTTDALTHKVTISYADSFSDGNNSRNTLAYPTTVTDPDNFSTTTGYNFDFGAVTRRQTPQPNTTTNTPGPIQTINYDLNGRIQRVNSLVNNAYTRFIYGPNYIESFASVNNVADEAHSLQVFDGVGRIIATASSHPGSNGGFSGQLILYDASGRAIKTSNPTETSASGTPTQWGATGDDASSGWLYTQQTYDWKGRPSVTTNTDGTTKAASYSGCGCAGGEVMTLAGEVVMLPPQSGSGAWSPDRRKQKIYSDVLGRAVKREILNQDGTPYMTTVTEYDARDQVQAVKEYKGAATSDGSCPSGTCQLTITDYDGHGRLKTRHLPEQNAGTFTTWDYNSDDTIQRITDARGASKTFDYNARHLVAGITYAWPGGGTVPTPATFGYDAAGNRTSMTDGTGSVTYHYDQLSRMDWEERTFTGLSGSTYRLSYAYNLGGQVTSLAEPSQFGSSVSYGYDVAGRLNGVTGSGFAGGVSQLASNMKYRAGGVVKEMSYGNGLKLNNSFNSSLQITGYQVKVPGTPVGQGEKARTDYEYEEDGRIKSASDRTDPGFNRSYSYDLVGRLMSANTGSAAYYQNFGYDEFDNLTNRGNGSWRHYDTTVSQYLNNRNTQTTIWPTSYPSCCPPQPSYWVHDADGNVTNDHNKQYSYDAAGNKRLVFENNGARLLWIYQDYDADGERVKRVEQTQSTTVTSYYLRSSVLDDRLITELNEYGQKRETSVYANGIMLVHQKDNQVRWTHVDPVTSSLRETATDGTVIERLEFDPLGNDAPLIDPAPPDITPDYEYPGNYGNNGNPYDGPSGCMIDGQQVPCSMMMNVLRFGTGVGRDGGSIQFRAREVGWRTWRDGPAFGVGVIRIPGDQIKPNAAVIQLVNDALSSKDCQEFMKAMLMGASTKDNPALEGGDIQKIFADFLAQRKGGLSRDRVKGADYGTVQGRIGTNGDGNGIIHSYPVKDQDLGDASTIVNELPHLAGTKEGWPKRDTYDDYALAQAINKTAYGSRSTLKGTYDPRVTARFPNLKGPKNPFERNPLELFPGSKSVKENRYSNLWSNYVHDIINQLCGVKRR